MYIFRRENSNFLPILFLEKNYPDGSRRNFCHFCDHETKAESFVGDTLSSVKVILNIRRSYIFLGIFLEGFNSKQKISRTRKKVANFQSNEKSCEFDLKPLKVTRQFKMIQQPDLSDFSVTAVKRLVNQKSEVVQMSMKFSKRIGKKWRILATFNFRYYKS